MIRTRLVAFLVLLFPFASPGLAQNPEPRPLVEQPAEIEADELGMDEFEAEERAARERRLELLAGQLSLDGFRALLADRIRADRELLEDDLRIIREEEARRAEEARAVAEAERALEANPVLRRMLEEGEAARFRYSYGPDPVELAVTSAALGQLLERLDDLERAAAASRDAEERLLEADRSDDIGTLQIRVRSARRDLEDMLRDLAADIIDSGMEVGLLVSELQEGMAGAIIRAARVIGGDPCLDCGVAEPVIEAPVVIAEPAPAGGPSEIHVDIGGADPLALLPELFPWPPPRASASAVIRSAFFSESLGADPTLGEVSDLLVGAMSEAGYHDLSYLGVPGGFALVTRIEQTRQDGTPLEDRARWAARIERVKSFSLSDILRAIFTAPEGYYRVIALIVTDTPFSERGGEALLSTVETWIGEGVNVLPVAIETLPFTDGHDVTALVYEFRKRTDTDAPSVNLSDPLPAPRHLAHTRLAGGFR